PISMDSPRKWSDSMIGQAQWVRIICATGLKPLSVSTSQGWKASIQCSSSAMFKRGQLGISVRQEPASKDDCRPAKNRPARQPPLPRSRNARMRRCLRKYLPLDASEKHHGDRAERQLYVNQRVRQSLGGIAD